MNGLLHMHGPAVKKLLGWKIGEDEEKWCEKAVEALVKKLKKKNNGCGTLEDLGELRSMETCSYPYESSSKTMFICINPYHYQRVARGMVGAIGGYSMPSPQPVESPQNALWQTGSSTASCSSSPSPSVFSEDGELQPTHPRRPFRHPKSWAQITYFELNTRVGEVFKLVNPSITVDGYTDPSNSDTR
uniref:MH2 domain-containing protein n=1 Tax=Caenorhabditis japonica TaxID=281687 RepID=A0A8R1ICJ8_CAEJA